MEYLYNAGDVGGRLQRSLLPIQGKKPTILSSPHPVTDLIIMMQYQKEGHLGTSQVLASINKEFWILKGKAAVKRVLK